MTSSKFDDDGLSELFALGGHDRGGLEALLIIFERADQIRRTRRGLRKKRTGR